MSEKPNETDLPVVLAAVEAALDRPHVPQAVPQRHGGRLETQPLVDGAVHELGLVRECFVHFDDFAAKRSTFPLFGP